LRKRKSGVETHSKDPKESSDGKVVPMFTKDTIATLFKKGV